MSWQTSRASVLLALWLVSPALGGDKQADERKLMEQLSKAVKAESEKAVSEYIRSFPNVFQLRDAAKAFTGQFSDAEAVAFLKKVADSTDLSEMSRAEHLAACIGLGLIADRHDTASFLKAGIGDNSTLRSRHGFAGITFLPTKDARRVAESVALDAKHKYQTRIQYLFLLRAVGDKETLAKLEKIERANESPAVWKVRERTAAFIKQRLSLENPAEQNRWAQQELVFVRMSCWDPNFRSGTTGLAWAAEQIHGHEKEMSVDLLKARLSLARPRAYVADDWNIGNEIPMAAALAAIQKNTELLPLLDEWAATDFGFISDACGSSAKQLRGRK